MIRADITMVGPGLFDARIDAFGLLIRSRYPELAICRRLAEMGHGAETLVTYRGDVQSLTIRGIGAYARCDVHEDGTMAAGFRVQSATAAPPARETDPTHTDLPDDADESPGGAIAGIGEAA